MVWTRALPLASVSAVVSARLGTSAGSGAPVRIRWYCTHYADLGIMPMGLVKPLVVAVRRHQATARWHHQATARWHHHATRLAKAT